MNLRCSKCGKFMALKSNFITKRLYDHSGAVEDIFYHADCENLNEAIVKREKDCLLHVGDEICINVSNSSCRFCDYYKRGQS